MIIRFYPYKAISNFLHRDRKHLPNWGGAFSLIHLFLRLYSVELIVPIFCSGYAYFFGFAKYNV